MAQKQYLDFAGLQNYHGKLTALIDEKDAAMLAAANEFAEGLGSNYDAAGTAQTKVNELAEGAVKANTEALAKLNGAVTAEGSVAKAVADAKDELQNNINAAEAKADAAQAAADKAQEDVDAVELDMGDVDGLSTENKTVVGAINEVLAAVGTGGTAAVITLTTDTTSDGMLKSYTLKQGGTTVGVIDIPKDMVVESGSVVVNPDGQTAGTYIKLVLANVAEPLFINVGSLVDLYTAKASASQVQVAIDPQTREISASIVAGSVTAAELANNAVVTAKIADANVTKAKLSTSVQASLDKADASATKTEFDAEVERATAAEAKALSDAKEYANGLVETEKTRAEGIEVGLETRLAAVEAKFGDSEGDVESQIEAAKAELLSNLEAAIAGAKTDASNKDAVVLAEAQNGIAAIQAVVDAHTDNGDIHVTTADKTKWNAAVQASDIVAGSANGTISVKGADIAVTGLGSAAYAATTAFDASGSAAQALADAKAHTDAAIANFVEISESEINALFGINS